MREPRFVTVINFLQTSKGGGEGGLIEVAHVPLDMRD